MYTNIGKGKFQCITTHHMKNLSKSKGDHQSHRGRGRKLEEEVGWGEKGRREGGKK